VDTIAVIPARGGSKRIPRKNLVEIAGKPLLAWTIEAAREAALLDRVFVSTEDPEIADVALRWGAEVIERPTELAADVTGTEPVLLHALGWLWERERYQPDALTLLQCTSPLRGSDIIDRAIERLIEHQCDAVVGVHPTIDYFFCGKLLQGRFVTNYDPQRRPRTQEIEPRYRENGSIYVTRVPFLLESGCRMGGDSRAVVMSPVEGLDIDDLHDLAMARYHLERRAPAAPRTGGGFAHTGA
jgi:N-acylneuraminate cytidylyltransferase